MPDKILNRLGRCQAMQSFRPDPWLPAPWMAGPVSDRMRCTSAAITTVRGINLCGIHTLNKETTDKAVRCAWPNEKG